MNTYLETAIAVILIIVIFSIVTYVIQELIAANLKYRGSMLKESFQLLLDGQLAVNITTQFYNHPQIKKLQQDINKLPSYVPAANFAVAIMDMVAAQNNAKTGNLLTDFKTGIATFAAANGDLKIWLQNFADTSPTLEELKKNMEKWYNDYMDRVTGWYKEKSKFVTRIIAICVAIAFNLNMVKVTQEIYRNDTLRIQLVNNAEKFVEQQDAITKHYLQPIDSALERIKVHFQSQVTATTPEQVRDSLSKKQNDSIKVITQNYTANRIKDTKDLLSKTNIAELPIGWNYKSVNDFKNWGWSLVLIGWFIGAAAISMGAPFWFDLLVKLVNIRKAGIKPVANDEK